MSFRPSGLHSKTPFPTTKLSKQKKNERKKEQQDKICKANQKRSKQNTRRLAALTAETQGLHIHGPSHLQQQT